MNFVKWAVLIVVVLLVMGTATIYGTSKDVWEAGNSDYIPEGK